MQGKDLEQATRQAIHALREAKIPIRKIAKLLHVSKASVERYGGMEPAGVVGAEPKKTDLEEQIDEIASLSGERLLDALGTEKKIPLSILNAVWGTSIDKRLRLQEPSKAADFFANLFNLGARQRMAGTLAGSPTLTITNRPAIDVTPKPEPTESEAQP
jgi:predicted transcriptional regulator